MNAIRPSFRFAALLLFVLVWLGGNAPAQTTTVPATLAYQGYLTGSEGQPLDGNLAIEFALYIATSGGSAVWQEAHPAVPVRAGFFQVELGLIESLPDSVFDGPLFLGIAIDGDPELTPRSALASVPFARRAGGLLACAVGETNCGGLCAALDSDANNCGRCGISCASGETCVSGVCSTCTTITWYRDADDDGYGQCNDSIVACSAPDGYGAQTCGDCNDLNASVHPDANEICDGIDNDCDGTVDEDEAVNSCNDGNSCSIDACGAGVCSWIPEPDGTSCEIGTCQSGMCAPACSDGIRNGNETDVDCGGPNCQECVSGRTCLVGNDCLSGICTAGICN